MTNGQAITFVRTRHEYQSYTDFFDLVKLAGYPLIYVDELRPDEMEGTFIVAPMNGEWRPHIDNHSGPGKPRTAHLVLWNLERPSGDGAVGKYARNNRELLYHRYVDEVWVSDRKLAEETELRYVTLGSDYRLGSLSDEKIYEFTHMSYVIPRRQTIYKEFPEGVIGPNSWGDKRMDVLRKSKFALNVHQDLHPFQEPLRFALFAAYGLPLVTEIIYDSFPLGNEHMVMASYDTLPEVLRRILGENYEKYRDMGRRFRELLCVDYNFRKVVDLAVWQSVGDWR